MIDRSKCKRMLVRNNVTDNFSERIVIDFFIDGSCISVVDGDEIAFRNHEYYTTARWNYFKPIPEKKTRPMTVNEAVKFLHETPCFVKLIFNEVWMTPYGITEECFQELIKDGEFKLLDGTIGKFEVEEKVL